MFGASKQREPIFKIFSLEYNYIERNIALDVRQRIFTALENKVLEFLYTCVFLTYFSLCVLIMSSHFYSLRDELVADDKALSGSGVKHWYLGRSYINLYATHCVSCQTIVSESIRNERTVVCDSYFVVCYNEYVLLL